MCGIAGALGRFSAEEAAGITGRMISALMHRGPDDRGVHTFSAGPHAVSLGNTRLSIQDLSAAGHQPMTENRGRYWIAFNGEIYNFRELRKLMDAEGRLFRTGTDTETILYAFDRWSAASFRRLRGMFAFALYDSQDRVLHLVRDGYGIKPVYYFAQRNRMLFASEVRALLASQLAPSRINPDSVTHYLRYGWVGGTETIIEGIKLLEPGHVLRVDLGQPELSWSVSAWNEPPAAVDCAPPDPNESAGHVRHLLEQSVKSHLVSDVPVSLFLSGGIDSTVLLDMVSRMGTGTPKTFTVVFREEHFSERKYARQAAHYYGAQHHEMELSESELLEQMPAALAAMDQPTMDGINTFVISRAVSRAGMKVALSGLGGDELFAGYPSHRRARAARLAARIPQRGRQGLARAGRWVLAGPRFTKGWDLLASDCKPGSAYRVSRRLFDDFAIRALTLLAPLAPEEPGGEFDGDEVNTVSRLEMEGYMTGLLLRDTDCMSMANSLEVRVPFIHDPLARYVLRLPGRRKLRRSVPKSLLVEAMRGSIPKYIWHRRKMGFTFPFDRWMRSAFCSEIRAVFSDRKLSQAVGLSSGEIQKFWQGFLAGSVRWSKPWSLYVLLRWCERYRASI